jgi:catechol-2,3-dioxygenase
MDHWDRPIKTIGGIALRVRDLDTMQRFYAYVTDPEGNLVELVCHDETIN